MSEFAKRAEKISKSFLWADQVKKEKDKKNDADHTSQ